MYEILESLISPIRFKKNLRQEYDIRRGPFAKKPTLNVDLSTHNINLDFQKEHNKYFKNYIGVNFSQQENYNIPGTGVNSVLPNYNSKTIGAYLSEEFKKDTWILNAGIRFDYKTFGAAGFDALSRYYSGEKIFKNFSYNFGINKTLDKYFSLTSNIGMAWRAPEAIELFADGVFHRNAFYVVGNRESKSERGLKWSSNIQYTSKRLLISTDFFRQRINGFIYEFPTGNFRNTWAGEMPIFLYKQSDAFFRGVDITLKYKPIFWMNYTAKGSLIHASNLTENYYFPNISPENISQQINFNLAFSKPLKDSFFSIEHLWSNKQKRFSKETDLIPFTPNAYHIFNISLDTHFKNLSVSISINNLFNTLYKDYTDRFRYFVHGMGRNVQLRLNYQF